MRIAAPRDLMERDRFGESEQERTKKYALAKTRALVDSDADGYAMA